jgi:hypothetical protein
MTIREYRPGDLVIFCDTGREHPKTYKFLNDFEAFEGIPVIRIKYSDSQDPFRALLAKYDFRKIPNRMKRICTVELKIMTAKRYLKKRGILRFINLLGFRADEDKRVREHVSPKKVLTEFPLYKAGIDKQQVDAYWVTKPYRLEIPRILGNCTLCFLKGQAAIMAILREYPELADPWIEDERLAALTFGHTYLTGITIKQLRDLAQNNLFKDYGLDHIDPAFSCGCTT